jgi:tetratricopeptide (TPR) repeat protein
MSKTEQLRAALVSPEPLTPVQLQRLAFDGLDWDLAEEVAQRLERELGGAGAEDSRIWQGLGLARRALQDSEAAHSAFAKAEALAPGDALIGHSLARTALEAGFPAVRLFERARTRAPDNADVLQGLSAALLAEGRGDEALRLLADALKTSPGWSAGHYAFARIARAASPDTDPLQTVLAAAVSFPDDAGLWFSAIHLALEQEAFPQAIETIERASRAIGQVPELDRLLAVSLTESGEAADAMPLFNSLPPAPNAGSLIHPLRTLIRLGRYDQALAMAERDFRSGDSEVLWPYRTLLWRLLGKPEWEDAEGDPWLIGIYDLSAAIGPIDQLADCLRGLHRGVNEPLGQSVRGGSQTDGNLLARAEPELRQLRAAVLDAVARHVAQLPAAKAGHPTLIPERGRVRLNGSWSIRLSGQGFHVDHVHMQGWLSSAFYVVLPEAVADSKAQSGWLAFGENRRLLPELDGFRVVQPQVGQLVLFPSLMWHGTRPFGAGERISVAFDVAKPMGNR